MTVAVPGGTSIDKDGNIAIPAGKEAEISLPESKAEVTAPGGTTITAGGTVTVGSGTANIALPGGTAVSVPAGSTIRPDGTVSIGIGGATVHISIGAGAPGRAIGRATGNNSGAAVQNSDGSIGVADESVPLGAAPGTLPGTAPSLTLKLAANTVIVLDEAAPLGYSVTFDNPYSDVNSSDWFYGDVAFASAHGLMTGTAAGKFSPNLPMTRAMLVTALHRLAGSPKTDGMYADFSDVKQGAWHEAAVAWAAKAGIAGGVGEGRFAPDANVTREQAAAIIFNYAKYAGATPGKEPALPDFADMDKAAAWALDGLRYCADAGVISGKPAPSIAGDSEHQPPPQEGQGASLFDPKGEASRAEVAAMLHRFVLALAGEDTPSSPPRR
jgi:hypothetical protein